MELKIGKLKITLGWKTLICFIVFLCLLGIDLGTKAIQTSYDLRFDVIPGKIWVEGLFYNDGVSFGWLSGRTWIIELLTTVLVVALLIVFIIIPNRMPLLKLSVGFVMAGALGNLVDRFMYGAVRDFIHDELITHTILNMADLFITIGVILVIIDMLFINEWSLIPLTKTARAIQKAKKEEEAQKLMDLKPDKSAEDERTVEDVMKDFLKGPEDVDAVSSCDDTVGGSEKSGDDLSGKDDES
ncbi:MAG: signal peptidase II [Clostridia bacterium]|nr:signal peptidase II [Clostridia bacterium]